MHNRRITISARQAERLAQLASWQGRSPHEIADLALEAYYERFARHAVRPGSLLDAMRANGTLGCLKDAPANLRDHLDGLGRVDD